MKKILILCIIFFSGFFAAYQSSYAAGANNLNVGGIQNGRSINNDKLNKLDDGGQFIATSVGGERGIYNTLVRFARDLKNLFFAVATIYFLIIALRLILASNTEEELGKFKKGIIWITVGIIVMQIAFSATKIIFDRGVGETLAFNIIEFLIGPLIALLETLASVFFIAIAIFAFYRLVTANGNEEAVSKGKMTIVYAIIGFMLVRFARAIVEAFYGKLDCDDFSLGFIDINAGNCLVNSDVSRGVDIIITVINWLNSFVAIVVIIMIMYSGAQILLSGGDEEKLKKGKQALIYIAIGLLVLAANYLILTFFLIPEQAI